MAKNKMIESLNEEYQYTYCIPIDDSVSDLLNEKAKALISDDNIEYGFYIEKIFSKNDLIHVKISLVNPYDKETVCDGFFEVSWDEIKDSGFTSL